MRCRIVNIADVPTLARLNQQLIVDEGHRNRMTLVELESRMRGWLDDVYDAVLFEDDAAESHVPPLGYALYRRDAEWVYLRQFFIVREHRRQGLGRAALEWLKLNVWKDARCIRLDVLVHNAAAINFWRSVGFSDYCLTLESRLDG